MFCINSAKKKRMNRDYCQRHQLLLAPLSYFHIRITGALASAQIDCPLPNQRLQWTQTDLQYLILPFIKRSSVVDVIKLFLEEILISPKLRNWKTFVLMSEPALKCENNDSFKQINTVKLFIAFKMAYSFCSSFGGNLDFPEFLQKSFIASTTPLSNIFCII